MTLRTAGLVLVASVIASAQTTEKVPLPLIEPEVVKPQPGQLAAGALTTSDKVDLWKRRTFGPSALANRAIMSGWSQWRDHPEEWGQGMEGYGKRFANRMGRLAVRNTIMLGADVAFKTDPRYDLCDCDGVWRRVGHAAKRVLVARSDYGGETVNVSRIAGAYVTPWITYEWYPQRMDTTQRKLMSGTSYLAWRAAGNVMKEFWPDIRRKFRRK